MTRSLLLCSVLAFGSGCAFTQADLDIHFDAVSARKGPLAEVPPAAFEYAALTDSRIDRARIGHKKNTYGQNTADIQPRKPVTEIVQEAVRLTFEANGHPTATPAAVRVEGDVTQFWFDTQMNFWTVEFMATVESKLRFVDAASGGLLYEGAYIGHYNEKSGGGYEKSWARVINLALGRMAEAVAFDGKLAAAIRARGEAAAAPAAPESAPALPAPTQEATPPAGGEGPPPAPAPG
jgi:hypothetical protein